MFFNIHNNLIARFVLILVLLSGVFEAVPTRAQGTIYRVAPGGATSGSCGADWSNPCDLQYALIALSSADAEVWVAAGTYKPTSSSDRTISFNLKNGVAIYGGFAGIEIARDQRNYQTNPTILSGDIGVEGNSSDNSYHVLVGSNTDNSALLDGFTITAGNANDVSSPYRSGGGMYIEKGVPRLNGLIFTENHAGFGGGIYTSHIGPDNPVADLVLTQIVFRDNTATWEGGGMALGAGNPPSLTLHLSLTDVVFENNAAVRTGGGLINNGGELELEDVTFSGNTATGGGGLSHIPYGPSTLTNVTFSNNYASEGGGGMLVGSSGSTLTTLTNVTFNNNSTALKGGGIANAGDSNLDLTNVTFSGNTAGENGGGLSNGGIIETSGTVNLVHTTFSNNTVTSDDSAIYNEGGNLNIHNSILYGDNGREIVNNAGTAAVTYSIVEGGYTGTGNLDADPLLGPLQDNGSFTQTMALSAGSPAIDAGDDTICPDVDQRGMVRPQGVGCDMGAYEFQPVSTIRYVRWNAIGANNGTSWSNAFTDLQSALSAASNGDEIWVASGTYKPTSGTERTIPFALESGVAIYGGFAGTEISLTQRNHEMNRTILSGNIRFEWDNSDNSYHVVVGSNTNNSAILDGFIVTGGYASSLSDLGKGGGMFNNAGSPTIRNTIFIDNFAFFGGGIANESNSNPTFTNVTFKNNAAQIAGGGIYNYTSSPSLMNITFYNNSADYGGGMANENNSHPELINTTFSENLSQSYGGGILNRATSNPVLKNVTFSLNTAADEGGAIANDGSSPIISNSILYGNSGGEIASINASVPIVTHSIVQGGYTGTGNIDQDPLLGPLQDNGGFTQTMALGASSAAIDTADDTNCPATDQRGVTRPQGARCDIGAYEYQPVSTVHYVKWNATGANNGTSWANAYMDLQSALAAASIGDEIWVAAGTYIPGNDRTSTFSLKDGVAMYGGFAGTEISREQRDPSINMTVFSGDLNGNDNGSLSPSDPTRMDNAFHVVSSIGVGSATVLDGFTILDGNAYHLLGGGGPFDPRLKGGGMWNVYGNPMLANLIFRDNTGTNGGGMYSSGDVDSPSAPSLTNVVFHNNLASVGGGMFNSVGSDPLLKNVTFSDNSASGGGGIYTEESNPTLINVTFSGNSAGGGGGLYNNHSGSPTLVNVTIKGNSASSGGAIVNADSNITIYNSILYGNSGGEIRNTSVNHLGTVTVTYSIVKGGYVGTGNIDQDPLLGPLQDNGGFTETMALGAGSPAIDAADHTNCPAADQRGVTRPQGAGCDIGAYEYTETAIPTVTISGNTGVGQVLLYSPFLQPVTSNELGDYSLTVPLGWTGTIVPSREGYLFDPSFRTFSDVQEDRTDQDFVARRPPLISGNAGIEGAILSYTDGYLRTVISNMQGDYSFQVLEGWSGTVTISKPNYTFVPPTRNYLNVQADQTSQDYTAIPLYVISGNVGVTGATLSYMEDGTSKMVSSDNNGDYSLVVKAGWAGAVTPSKPGVTFEPASRTYTALQSNQAAQNYIAYDALESTVEVTLANLPVDLYVLSPHESIRASYPGANNGPVEITNTDNVSMIAAERVIYKTAGGVNTSFSEMMGLPANQLDTTYWLPWYNNVDLDTQLRIANVSDSPATVTVTIGGVPKPSFNLAAGESSRVSYLGINNGPVKIVSTHGVPIVASERVIYKVNGVNTSFTEMMALPNGQLDTTYWLPWYNNVDLDTQLRIANVSGSPATVTVTIGGIPRPSFNLAAGASTRLSYPGVNDGPVKIESTHGVPIVAAERVIYKVNGVNTSFSEMMAQAASQLNQTYWLSWYNNVDLDTQLRVANVSGSPATVTVIIGGVPQPSFALAAGESTRISFPSVNNGPVEIVSTQDIVAAERVIYKVNGTQASFSEMMGLPNDLLDTTFWFPWYNNVDLDTQLRFAAP